MENIINSQSKVSPSFTQSYSVMLCLGKTGIFFCESLKETFEVFSLKRFMFNCEESYSTKSFCFSPSNQKDLINDFKKPNEKSFLWKT
jgi:hypothetical protein